MSDTFSLYVNINVPVRILASPPFSIQDFMFRPFALRSLFVGGAGSCPTRRIFHWRALASARTWLGDARAGRSQGERAEVGQGRPSARPHAPPQPSSGTSCPRRSWPTKVGRTDGREGGRPTPEPVGVTGRCGWTCGPLGAGRETWK